MRVEEVEGLGEGPQHHNCSSDCQDFEPLSIQQHPGNYLSLNPDPQTLGQVDEVEGLAKDHNNRQQVRGEGSQQRARTMRCMREFCSLASDLPCNPCSSVFVRADQGTITLWRALITGERCSV